MQTDFYNIQLKNTYGAHISIAFSPAHGFQTKFYQKTLLLPHLSVLYKAVRYDLITVFQTESTMLI